MELLDSEDLVPPLPGTASDSLDQRVLPGSRCSTLLLVERRSDFYDGSFRVLSVCVKAGIRCSHPFFSRGSNVSNSNIRRT